MLVFMGFGKGLQAIAEQLDNLVFSVGGII